MQAAPTSRPASGAEHQFSHLWDMQHHTHDGPPLSHGFKVGIGTLASPRSTSGCSTATSATRRRRAGRRLAHGGPGRPRRRGGPLDRRRAHGGGRGEPRQARRPEQLAERLELVRTRWPELRERLVGQLLPAAELAEMLRAAGAPSRPADIGVSAETLRDSYYRCRTIRRRYTVLDLAAETGVLESCVEELFAPGGFWA